MKRAREEDTDTTEVAAESSAESSAKKQKTNASSSKSVSERLALPAGLTSTSPFITMMQDRANMLMNEYVIVMNNEKLFRIAELEFYLCDKETPTPGSKSDAHFDIYSHKCSLQLTNAQWYFHKAGTNYEKSKFKGGSYKGLDITFGNDNFYGGILLRSLLDEELKYLEGPSLLVDQVLKQTGAGSIETLVDEKLTEGLGIEKNKKILTLMPVQEAITTFDKKKGTLEKMFKETKLYKSPRVGLTLKKVQIKKKQAKKTAKKKKTSKKKKDQDDDDDDEEDEEDEPEDEAEASSEGSVHAHEEYFLRYLMKEYRYFLFPKQMKKGKNYLAASLIAEQKRANPKASQEEIATAVAATSGIGKTTVKNYIKSYEKGATSKEPKPFYGQALKQGDIIELCGILFE